MGKGALSGSASTRRQPGPEDGIGIDEADKEDESDNNFSFLISKLLISFGVSNSAIAEDKSNFFSFSINSSISFKAISLFLRFIESIKDTYSSDERNFDTSISIIRFISAEARVITSSSITFFILKYLTSTSEILSVFSCRSTIFVSAPPLPADASGRRH
jgi:hypothetical protein